MIETLSCHRAIARGKRHTRGVLRTMSSVRALGADEADDALELCARHPVDNCFVASRILEGALYSQPGTLLGHREGGRLVSMLWASSNIVPVELDPDDIEAYALRIGSARRQCASIFGPQEAVGALWRRLAGGWGPARSIRGHQPLMSTSQLPSRAGIPIDPRVRFGDPDETDDVLPAAAHMFTEEIGYPPYYGSPRAYRAGIRALLEGRRTLVRVEGGEVVFKADVGSLAEGVAQVQGVWLHPALRGRGMATAAMAAATELILTELAPTVSLYVNDYNIAARATYLRCGYRDVGSFATILM